MDIELALNKFVESSIKHKIKEDDEVTYSEHHASLLVIFCFSIADKIHPKKFAQSWVFNILKRESSIPPNEEIIRHNICNVELQPNICDI